MRLSKYGFYGAVDSRNCVMKPANVVVDGGVYGFLTTANPRAYFYVEFKTVRAPFELLFKWVDTEGKPRRSHRGTPNRASSTTTVSGHRWRLTITNP
ncbi:MAG: hypothetical protein QXK69_04935 [Candidatus Caldarchaeum sp.]|uniref:Uncharacterized protein n=1 Tax=Caldiarchaeum subterraneum TaxID=311458 RepID=A0A7C5QDP3_CALS0